MKNKLGKKSGTPDMEVQRQTETGEWEHTNYVHKGGRANRKQVKQIRTVQTIIIVNEGTGAPTVVEI